MKKRLAAYAVFLFALPLLSHSQLRLALTGGPHSSTIIEENQIADWSTNTKPYYTARNSFHFGVLIEAPLGNSSRWFLHPGITYMPKGRKFFHLYDTARAGLTDTTSLASTFSINYIEIPFNLTYKLPLGGKTRLLLSAGPYVGFFYNGKQSFETRKFFNGAYSKEEQAIEAGDEPSKAKTADAGVNVRAGLEVGKVWISACMSQGLSSFYRAEYEGSFKHKTIGASLSIWLNRATPVLPKDTDEDGIADRDDGCPQLPGTALTGGCPDKDGDGYQDKTDKCPDVAGVEKYKGCPVPDSDHDGVNDEQDKCPDLIGTAAYAGCPIPDTDKDGINDEDDVCPAITGTKEYWGCPTPDRDNDGVEDLKDHCPDHAGPGSNNGCPELNMELKGRVNLVAQSILFEMNSDRIDQGSFKPLDELVELLRSNPASRLVIEGHTDNTGSKQHNLRLSEKRALAVKNYLVQKGVDVSRLESVGYGAERPISENTSAKGKASNRRVELQIR